MYRLTNVKIWKDRKFRELIPQAKLFFWYSFSNEHSHVSGVYYLPVSYMQADLGMGEPEIMAAIGALEALGMLSYDQDNEWIFVHNMFQYQGINPKTEAATKKNLAECESSYIHQCFRARYPGLVPEQEAETMGILDTLSEGYQKGLETVPVSGSGSGSGSGTESKSSTDTQSNKKTTASGERGAAKKAGAAVDTADVFVTKRKRSLTGESLRAFEQFWSLYDWKKDKRNAADAWLDLNLEINAETLNPIFTAAKQCADMRARTNPDGRGVKYAQGWLSSRRWEDETQAGTKPPRQARLVV